jgi:hypothetical protein
MEKLNFATKINAPREKVWNVLFDDNTYRIWAAEFMPGSYAETDWKEGSRALFLDGSRSGMVSQIASNKPNEFMSIKHLGMIKNGVEDLQSEKVKQWSGVMENYTLKDSNGTTELIIDMDTDDEYKDYFAETWPKALQKVKELSERKN